MSLSKSQRLELFNKYGGRCAYCGCELPKKGWHADHVEPVEREWWKKTEWWKRSRTSYRPNPETGVMETFVDETPMGMKHPHRDCLENMTPACRACNIDKGVFPLEDWRTQLERRPQVLRDNYSAYRHAERFGLVAQINTAVVFYFERPPAAEEERSSL